LVGIDVLFVLFFVLRGWSWSHWIKRVEMRGFKGIHGRAPWWFPANSALSMIAEHPECLITTHFIFGSSGI
jgi:hypothetical protein